MGAWDGPDDRPGSHASLYVLYSLVPVAEEEDLLDEVRRERIWRDRGVDPWVATEDEDGEDPDVAEASEESPALTLLQMLGMLEHILGAVIVDPEEEADEA